MKLVNTLQKLKDGVDLKIVALGDSLTFGWMTEYGYIDYLKTMIKQEYPASIFSIFNKGIPGDTARDGLRRVENDVIRLSPDLVLIQFALNDAYTGFSPEDFQSNLESIILKIKDRDSTEIALLTSVALLNHAENKFAQEYYKKISESGLKYNIPVVKVHEYWETKINSGIKHTLLVQLDGIHPTESGYKFMAEAVFDLFR